MYPNIFRFYLKNIRYIRNLEITHFSKMFILVQCWHHIFIYGHDSKYRSDIPGMFKYMYLYSYIYLFYNFSFMQHRIVRHNNMFLIQSILFLFQHCGHTTSGSLQLFLTQPRNGGLGQQLFFWGVRQGTGLSHPCHRDWFDRWFIFLLVAIIG